MSQVIGGCILDHSRGTLKQRQQKIYRTTYPRNSALECVQKIYEAKNVKLKPTFTKT
jgi:hypothetical protein